MRYRKQLQFKRFKLPRPLDKKSKTIGRTRYFKISPTNYKKNNGASSTKISDILQEIFLRPKSQKDLVQVFEEIADHTGIYLSREDDLE